MEKFVFIKTGKATVKAMVDDIVLIQGLGNYVLVHTAENKKHTYYSSLNGLMDKLSEEFMRIHKSYIINLNHIDKIEDNHVYLNGHKIPVSLGKRDCLQQRIEQYKL